MNLSFSMYMKVTCMRNLANCLSKELYESKVTLRFLLSLTQMFFFLQKNNINVCASESPVGLSFLMMNYVLLGLSFDLTYAFHFLTEFRHPEKLQFLTQCIWN